MRAQEGGHEPGQGALAAAQPLHVGGRQHLPEHRGGNSIGGHLLATGSRRATSRLSHCGLPHPNSVSGMTNVVELTGVVNRFGTVTVLDGLDLEVTEGEVHGFLGSNGAGKTTTPRLLLGLLRPNAGSIRVLGLDPWRNVATLHRRLAYVPGDVALWPNLTGGEVIDLLGRLQGGQDQARRERLLEMFDLDPTKKARTYSKGNRQKVALIAALATDAEVFLLDEPTSGLDPLMGARPTRRGAHHPAEQPHPQRSRGAVRPDQHHPCRQGGGDRPARAAEAPDPNLGHRQRRSRAAAPGAPARGP